MVLIRVSGNKNREALGDKSGVSKYQTRRGRVGDVDSGGREGFLGTMMHSTLKGQPLQETTMQYKRSPR